MASDTTTDYSELYQYMMPELPSCDSGLILQHIQRAFIDFCRRTQRYQRKLDPITIQIGTREYELDVDDDLVVLERVTAVGKFNPDGDDPENNIRPMVIDGS